MPLQLDEAETRVLGSLAACNRKSSRDPVMSMGLDTMGRAVQSPASGQSDRLEALEAAVAALKGPG